MGTFNGLEMAKQALFAQQSALYTTGNNIANANTPGYSRQRVNFETMSPYPSASRNRPEIPGQMGTGVEAGTVQRIRNKYLDFQFRAENSKAGYWEAKSDALSRMEGLLNEPSENGLSKTMDRFWQSLQDLAGSPDNSGARSVVVQRGVAVGETFNYLSNSLKSMRNDLKDQIENVVVPDANSILYQINEINKQIGNIEPHGLLSNDLYDDRDRLIDELSSIVNIKVTRNKSSESAKDIADGLVSIELVSEKGESMVPPAFLVNGDLSKGPLDYKQLKVNYDDVKQAVSGISIGRYDKNGENFEPEQELSVEQFASKGSLKGLIESYGYKDSDENVSGEYTDMLAELDKLAFAFVNEFNSQHAEGKDLNGDDGIDDFFEEITIEKDAAGAITVNKDIMDDPDLVAASEDGTDGNGNNASLLADVFDKIDIGLGETTSVRSFYQSLIGSMGVRALEANRMTDNADILRSQVEDQRMSVSSVSLDEEMTNMIKFQQAYNAAARSMTAIDEMLDRIINNMGLVGR